MSVHPSGRRRRRTFAPAGWLSPKRCLSVPVGECCNNKLKPTCVRLDIRRFNYSSTVPVEILKLVLPIFSARARADASVPAQHCAPHVCSERPAWVCVDKPLASSINGLAQHTKLEISPDVFVHYEGRFRCCWRELFKITRSSQSKRLMNIDDWLIRFDRDAKG